MNYFFQSKISAIFYIPASLVLMLFNPKEGLNWGFVCNVAITGSTRLTFVVITFIKVFESSECPIPCHYLVYYQNKYRRHYLVVTLVVILVSSFRFCLENTKG